MLTNQFPIFTATRCQTTTKILQLQILEAIKAERGGEHGIVVLGDEAIINRSQQWLQVAKVGVAAPLG